MALPTDLSQNHVKQRGGGGERFLFVAILVLLYGYEYFKFRDEHRLKMLRILKHMRDEVTGGWRKLHNNEVRNLYCSYGIITMKKYTRMGI
jgi:hypothetical protein